MSTAGKAKGVCVCGRGEAWPLVLLAGLSPAGLALGRLLHTCCSSCSLTSPGPREPSPSCWQPWLSGMLGRVATGVQCGQGEGFHAPQLEIQSCTHIAPSADFGSITPHPVLAEEMPFPCLPGELVAVCALLSSPMACAQLLPLPSPSIQLWLLSSPVPIGY